MATQTIPATDSAAELHDLIGDDATATFESDPNFESANPGAIGSSENVVEQRDTDDTEESDEEIEEGDEWDDEDEEEDEEDLEDEDDVDEDDEDEEDDVDEDDEDEEVDDAEEAAMTPLRMDGLLGYEDEQEDVEKKRDRAAGDADRNGAVSAGKQADEEEDDDSGDVDMGVDDEGLYDPQDEGEIDTDQVVDKALRMEAMIALLGQQESVWSEQVR